MSIKTRLWREVIATLLNKTHRAYIGLDATNEDKLVSSNRWFFRKIKLRNNI